MTVVAAGVARFGDLVRLWIGTLVANLGGGWFVGWIVVHAYPDLDRQAATTAAYYISAGINLRSLCLAVLAGSAITLLTRMHHGTDSVGARIVASVAIAFLLAGLRLFHSILDSLLAFLALESGHAPFGYLDWAGWFAWTVLGNMAGGLLLTTLLRLVRSKHRIAIRRAEAEEDGQLAGRESSLEIPGPDWTPTR